MYPSTEVYTQTVNTLLERHFGITLNDTSFDEEMLAKSIQQGVKAWELVNAIAEDADLERIDEGWMPTSRIKQEDEFALTLEHENSMTFSRPRI